MKDNSTPTSWEAAVIWLRDQPKYSKIVFDCYYDDPLIEAAKRYHYSDEWFAVKEIIGASFGRALDIGAGRGIASYALAMDGFEVTSLEPNPSELVGAGAIRSLSIEAGLNIRVVENFSEKLPFADGVFDLVFARAVLHHASDLKIACNELYRVLKPGGIFLAVREHVISKKSDISIFLDDHPLHHLYGGENAYLLDDYLAAIQGAGFAKVKIISPWGSPLNYSPRTLEELKADLVVRVDKLMPIFSEIFRIFLRVPGAWFVTRFFLQIIDNRPGRLYSFVVRKL